MQNFLLAFGEGNYTSTAQGIVLSLLTVVVIFVILSVYAVRTYPKGRE
jgi:hypothetical protein